METVIPELKKSKEEIKQSKVDSVMKNLKSAYQKDSAIYKRTEHGLMRLTLKELDALWVMTL